MRLDPEAGVASGTAAIPARLPVLADHFPSMPLLPGSLIIELAAQIAGPLCEDVIRLRHGLERGALLAMVREAVFLRPCFLPATLCLDARIERAEPARVSVASTARLDDALVFRGQLVLALIDVPPEWADALTARHARVAEWKARVS